MELVILRSKLRNRGGMTWIDCMSNYGRLRFSSGERWCEEMHEDIRARIKDLALSFLKGKGVKARVQAMKAVPQSDSSFGAVVESFLRMRCAGCKPQTMIKYKNHARTLGALIPYDIGLLDQASYDELVATLPKVRVDFLNRVIDFARECELLSSKIITYKPKVIETKEPAIKPLTLDQVPLVLHEAARLKDKHALEFASYLCVAFFTGARVGELLALEWGDIDYKNEKIYISKSKLRAKQIISSTKTSKARYIDMLEPVQLALRSHQALQQASVKRKHPERVFNLNEKKLSSMWKACLKACALESRVLYQTRHSFATIMLTNGEEPLWISAMLGHSSLQTTFTHYVKYIPQRKKRASFLDGVSLGLGGVE